ncbi:uncharacterized protein BX664DRAFT_109812 [Halteromyces radiatus]|uniref:uncharacterized protein n=1 Tax=Halteromyces radiatus TaxID=101107 RepID=UPI00221F243F|nr:uncharacterized protein BX664DRAFT_109812 [Halteromyces radiatus]KAI8093552.1 hypothetical protein BX664DRAFT_109812 [Halteromyces radiatus]
MDKGDLVENTRATLRFPITSIHVSGDCICVTGHTESVSFYSYDSQAEKIKFLKSDSISRNVHHSLLLDNHMVIGLSLSGGMFALQESTDTSKDSLQTLFAFHYPDIIIKPRLLSLHSNQSSEYTRGILASHLLPWTSMDELGKSQPIVGCTISGGMIMAYRCSSSLFTLLDTLQQALLRFGPTQPLLGSSSQFQQWYTQLSGPQTSTLHADYLFLYSRLTKAQQYQVIKQSDINLVTLTQELFSMDKTMETEQQQMEWTAITLATLIDKMDYYYY